MLPFAPPAMLVAVTATATAIEEVVTKVADVVPIDTRSCPPAVGAGINALCPGPVCIDI